MTQLRKMMLEELQRRNYSKTTTRTYLQIVRDFAKHFNRSPEHLGPAEIRSIRRIYSKNESWSRAPWAYIRPLCASCSLEH